MGLTIGCAKCHSHKYDPISQREYYQLMAVFNQTEDADRPNDDPRLKSPTTELSERLEALTEKIAALKLKAAESSDSTEGHSDQLKQLEKHQKELQAEIAQIPVMRELPSAKSRETFIHVRGNFLYMYTTLTHTAVLLLTTAGLGTVYSGCAVYAVYSTMLNMAM